MRVVQINCSSTGSTGTIASSLHKMLLEKGCNSFFVYGRGETDVSYSYRIGNEIDYRLHSYLSRITGLHGYYSHIPTLRLINKLKKINPDIIHLHNLHGDYINLPMLFKYINRFDVKVVVTLHDCWLFTGGCAHFTVPYCNGWKKNCGNCIRLNEYPKSYFFDNSKACLIDKKLWLEPIKNLKIITVSKWLKKQVEQSFLHNRDIETIYNGINTNLFYPRKESSNILMKYGLGDSKHIVLGVASVWTNNKGLAQFYELRKVLSGNYKIVLVGLTNSQIRSLPNGIIGIRKTDNVNELVSLYSAATVLINFSKEETFGMVPAEAMACGTPVIVSNTTACPEIVDNKNSFSIDLDNIERLINTVYYVTKNRNSNTSSECALRIEKYFSVEKMLNSYWNNYLNLYSI